MAPAIDTAPTLAALERAIAGRGPAPGTDSPHHSDYGVQYARGASTERLAGAAISMSATGSPYDNAKTESLFTRLKCKELYLPHYQTHQEAEANLGHFIEDVNNVKRLHSSLG